MSISWSTVEIGGPSKAYGPFTSGGGGRAEIKRASGLSLSGLEQRRLREQIAEEELRQRLNAVRSGGSSGGSGGSGNSGGSGSLSSNGFFPPSTSDSGSGSGSGSSGSTDYSSLITQQQANQRELMGLANQYRLSEIGANTDSQSRIQREGSEQAIQRMGADTENKSRLEREQSGYRITEGIQATDNSIRFEGAQAQNRERLQRQAADQVMEVENNRIGQQIRLDNVNRSESRKLWRGNWNG